MDEERLRKDNLPGGEYEVEWASKSLSLGELINETEIWASKPFGKKRYQQKDEPSDLIYSITTGQINVQILYGNMIGK